MMTTRDALEAGLKGAAKDGADSATLSLREINREDLRAMEREGLVMVVFESATEVDVDLTPLRFTAQFLEALEVGKRRATLMEEGGENS